MASDFNPYQQWLGLTGVDSPPDHFRLLGLSPGEDDAARIEQAAEAAKTRVRSHRPGAHAAEWADLLDAIEAARSCLTDPTARQAYRADLASGAGSPSGGEGRQARSTEGPGPFRKAAAAPSGPSRPLDRSHMSPPRMAPAGPSATRPFTPAEVSEKERRGPAGRPELQSAWTPPGAEDAASSQETKAEDVGGSGLSQRNASPGVNASTSQTTPPSQSPIEPNQPGRLPMGPPPGVAGGAGGTAEAQWSRPQPRQVGAAGTGDFSPTGPADDAPMAVPYDPSAGAYDQQPDYGQFDYGQPPAYGEQPNYGDPPAYGQQPGYEPQPPYGYQTGAGQPMTAGDFANAAFDPAQYWGGGQAAAAPSHVDYSTGHSAEGLDTAPLATTYAGSGLAADVGVAAGSSESPETTADATQDAPQVTKSNRSGAARERKKSGWAMPAIAAGAAIAVLGVLAILFMRPYDSPAEDSNDRGRTVAKANPAQVPAAANPSDPGKTTRTDGEDPPETANAGNADNTEPEEPGPETGEMGNGHDDPGDAGGGEIVGLGGTDEPGGGLGQPGGGIGGPAPQTTPPADAARLGQLLRDAKSALGRRNPGPQDLARVRNLLEQASALAVSPEHVAAVDRLRALSHHVEQFWDAFRQAVGSLQATDSIMLKGQRVGIVDITPAGLTVRVEGNNVSQTFERMLPETIVALTDTWLHDSPAAKTLKASFYAVDGHPQADRKAADRLWQEAERAGANLGDLPKVLDENYQF